MSRTSSVAIERTGASTAACIITRSGETLASLDDTRASEGPMTVCVGWAAAMADRVTRLGRERAAYENLARASRTEYDARLNWTVLGRRDLYHRDVAGPIIVGCSCNRAIGCFVSQWCRLNVTQRVILRFVAFDTQVCLNCLLDTSSGECGLHKDRREYIHRAFRIT